MDTIQNIQSFINTYDIKLINAIEVKENSIITPRKKPHTETVDNTLIVTLFYDGYTALLKIPILPLSIEIIESLMLFIRNEQNFQYHSFRSYNYS